MTSESCHLLFFVPFYWSVKTAPSRLFILLGPILPLLILILLFVVFFGGLVLHNLPSRSPPPFSTCKFCDLSMVSFSRVLDWSADFQAFSFCLSLGFVRLFFWCFFFFLTTLFNYYLFLVLFSVLPVLKWKTLRQVLNCHVFPGDITPFRPFFFLADSF